MGARSIITAAVAMVLGGGFSVALNALKTVLVTGCGGTLCARGSLVRLTLCP